MHTFAAVYCHLLGDGLQRLCAVRYGKPDATGTTITTILVPSVTTTLLLLQGSYLHLHSC
jgi:hypothetical protein